jgi:hypothetical protein
MDGKQVKNQSNPTGTGKFLNESGVYEFPPLPAGSILVDLLTADQSNSTVTLTSVTGMDKTLVAGTYQFKYMIRYQAGATTTGVRFSVNFSGTVSFFIANVMWVDTSATAATATPKQNNVQAAAAVYGAFSARAKSTTGWGTTLGVDTINADMLMVIEGTFEASTGGDIQLYHGSEVAAISTVKAGSSLVITKLT